MSFRKQRDLDGLTLPAGKSEVFHFDARCPGLSVRIQSAGKPAFVAWYTSPSGKRRRITIGAVAGIDLDDARRQAANIIKAARNGRDPVMERKQARAAAAEVFTVGDLITAYLRDHAERHQRPRTLIETKRALERHWLPLHDRPAGDVTRRDVSGRLIELSSTVGPVGANRARAHLSAAFAWAMKAGLSDLNPVVGTVKGEEVSRERVLSTDELASIWHATADLAGYDAIVRLLMLTWTRRLEVGGMARHEIDVEKALWNLPAARCKNHRSMAKRAQAVHEVPLSRQALAILAEFPELPGRPFLFGRAGRAAFSGWSQCKARLDERIARQRAEKRLGRKLRKGEGPESGDHLAPWRLHDLRRSGVTHAAEEGIAPPHIIEAVVGHASGHKAGVAGVYNRATHRTEKASALQAWANWLEAKVSGREPASNVIAMEG
jgi:integrase